MSIINTALSNISIGEAQCFENLEIIPLLAGMASKAEYLTLAEAQQLELAKVTEVSESGSVPTLLLENNADQAVFLLDGEELIGAKQNRILNLSVLVPPKSKLEIPVSCVEAGRWSHQSHEFTSTERTHFSRGRASKAAQVSENLRESGARYSNQGAVWNEIEMKMDRMEVESSTGAIADAYDHFSGSVDAYVNAFVSTETQVGACFVINGKLRGMELFDVSDTCSKLLSKLIRSYALDAIEEPHESHASVASAVQDFLKVVADAPLDSFDALGEGEDLRLHSTVITGGALAARERVIHLCAFSQEAEEGILDRSGGMRSANARRHARTRHGGQASFLDGDDVDSAA